MLSIVLRAIIISEEIRVLFVFHVVVLGRYSQFKCLALFVFLTQQIMQRRRIKIYVRKSYFLFISFKDILKCNDNVYSCESVIIFPFSIYTSTETSFVLNILNLLQYVVYRAFRFNYLLFYVTKSLEEEITSSYDHIF